MITVATPKDLKKVKPKLIGNFTKRQVICGGAAAIVGIPFYLMTKKTLGTDFSAILMVLVMMPFFFFAAYEKHGLPAEKFLMLVFRHRRLPEIRPYHAENLFQQLDRREKMKKEVEELEEKARIGKLERSKSKDKRKEKAGESKKAEAKKGSKK